MPTLVELGHLLISTRLTTPERWQGAAKRGAGSTAKILDALAANPPEWWTGNTANASETPPGLTDYQRGVIEHWFDNGGPPPHRQLALNRFLLLEKLGQGGQGEVYRARQLSPARFVAVKTLTQDTDAGRNRFEQEAKVMMRVQHPGVARFYLYERVRDAAGKPTNEYLIAMEYVEGTDLHRMGQWLGKVPWAFVVRWAVDLLGGLAVIHHNGFIHRDIKPANVMILGPAPEPGVSPTATSAKLLDFGAVKPTADGPRALGSRRIFVGTREYAPPEQWEEHVVPASDLYALGGTLFYALTNRPPFEVEGRDAIAFMKAHARAPIPEVRPFNPDVPEGLDRLIQRMLSKDPNDRSTATELLEEFREMLPANARPAESRAKPTTELPPKPPKPARPRPEPPAEEKVPESHGVVGSFLAALEWIFLPLHLRPPVGHEPPTTERILALLRRPLVLFTILVLLGLVIFLVMRA
jgi:serine/threonine protein kinase